MTEHSASPGQTTRNPVRSYSTRFTTDEDPISGGGMWINGKRDGIDWADVVVRNGVAYGATTRMTEAERRVRHGQLPASGAARPPGGMTNTAAGVAREAGGTPTTDGRGGRRD